MSMVVSILENFLGAPISHYEGKSQINFDCPMCSEDKGLYDGDGKGNLTIQYEKGVYKCWSCYDRNNMHGNLLYLVKKYGNKQHLKDYLLIAPQQKYKKDENEDDLVPDFIELPETFKTFKDTNKFHTNYTEAYNYLKKRGLTDKIINHFNIGYTCEGKLKDRIIIPSYDIDGNLNYFIARSFIKWAKHKYINPEAKKELIIFNENKINWDSTVYLVEGAFDHIVTPNSIPLLGKLISNKLVNDLQYKAKGDVVLVLDGGEKEELDGIQLYKKLNTLNLYNRVKIVSIKYGLDLSVIYEKLGKRGILITLRTAHKLKESGL